jgi:hypothetical protein
VRIPDISAEAVSREEIRAGMERLQAPLDYFVQTAHPGTIQLDGATASGRAYICELGRFRDGRSKLNYAVYHDRYQRTPDGWKFTERVCEVRYLDTSPRACGWRWLRTSTWHKVTGPRRAGRSRCQAMRQRTCLGSPGSRRCRAWPGSHLGPPVGADGPQKPVPKSWRGTVASTCCW